MCLFNILGGSLVSAFPHPSDWGWEERRLRRQGKWRAHTRGAVSNSELYLSGFCSLRLLESSTGEPFPIPPEVSFGHSGRWSSTGERDSVPSSHLVAFSRCVYDFLSLRRFTDLHTPERAVEPLRIKLGRHWPRRPKGAQTHRHVHLLSRDLTNISELRSGTGMRTRLTDTHVHIHWFTSSVLLKCAHKPWIGHVII